MIRAKEKQEKIVVDLTGPQGNAFYLLGLAGNLSKQLGFDEEKKEEVLSQMKKSDYHALVNTFDAYFGEYVILEV
jgi:alanine-alpha-ketoisovalerate/valine-pyruvate aminotransferase